jgi:lipoprotein-anchoring transpeptidase ErfK/SrfK
MQMNEEIISAAQAIRNATEALEAGDKQAARRWAQKAAFLDREAVKPWLILADISSPKAQAAYLEQADIIWTKHMAAATQSGSSEKESKQVGVVMALPASREVDEAAGTLQRERAKRTKRLVVSFLVFAFAAVVFFSACLYFPWPGGVSLDQGMFSSRLRFFGGDSAGQRDAAAAQEVAPLEVAAHYDTIEPSLTATPLPTATYTPFSAVTNTPTSTPTPLPTATATATPLPSPTEAPPESARPEGISLNSGKTIVVSISEQHVYAFEGENLVFSFAASTGRGNTTLAGNFRILDKIANAYSDPWGFWMPYWMGIYYVGSNLENGFHSLPVLYNGQELWGDLIGTPITYGCVVLAPGDMKQLFDWADISTPVEIIR